MSTFEQSKGLFNQTHFTIIEIDLPSVGGECTIGGLPGFGTPLSCDQSSDGITTYKFTQASAPMLPENGILRLVKSISENPAKLNSGRGLSSRGTGSIKLFDMTGKDPNPNAPGVTDEIKSQGGYLAKMAARNNFTNRALRIKNYRTEIDGTIDLLNGAQVRHFIIDSFDAGKNGEWTIKFKDELARVNIGETVWPLPLEGFLINDITDSQTTFNVDPNVDYQAAQAIRIGDELMKITSVSDIGTGTANITVQSRGTPINYTNTLSFTDKDEHSLGDEIFVCEVSDDEVIDSLLSRILIDIGVDASYIPLSEWAAEVATWHPNSKINTIWIESEDTADVMEKILSYFMIDMWFDPVSRLIKISAISTWQESTASLIEGNQIDFESISRKSEEALRATRALVFYDKRKLTDDDDIESYKKASLFAQTELETADQFGEAKTKKFDPSVVLDTDSANLLVNRWVNRYSNPFSFTWTTQERKLSFDVGDVVDIQDLSTVDFAGLPVATSRAQVTSIRPSYTGDGREYKISALAYLPNFETGSEFVISGNILNYINLYNEYAGAPPGVVEVTFIFDGTTTGTTGNSLPAIRAGAFAAGSVINIILINGADLQAAGGKGGTGGGGFYEFEVPDWIRTEPTNGADGGVVYDAEGVTTNIYFSGPTGNVNHPTADGYLRAPSGGAGGFSATLTTPLNSSTAGNGGAGGSGRSAGLGGSGGVVQAGAFTDNGDAGAAASEVGPFGIDGANNNAFGGAAGSGVVDSGATVTFYGDTTLRYINGNGDHV